VTLKLLGSAYIVGWAKSRTYTMHNTLLNQAVGSIDQRALTS